MKHLTIRDAMEALQEKGIKFVIDGQIANPNIIEHLITNKFTFQCIVKVPKDCQIGNKTGAKLDFLSNKAKDGLGNKNVFIINHETEKEHMSKDAHKLDKFKTKISKTSKAERITKFN